MTRTSLGTIAGLVVTPFVIWLLVRQPSSPQPQLPKSVTQQQPQASKPTSDGELLRRRAKAEGIEAVRPLFKQVVDQKLREMYRYHPGVSTSMAPFTRDTFHARCVFGAVADWARAEADASSPSTTFPADYEDKVWNVMWQDTLTANHFFRERLVIARRDYAEAIAEPKHRFTEYVLQYEEGQLRMLEKHVDPHWGQLAILAKRMGRHELVRKVFEESQAPAYMDGRFFSTADDFLQWREPVPDAADATKTLPKVAKPAVVTAKEQDAIRKLISKWAASVEEGKVDEVLSHYRLTNEERTRFLRKWESVQGSRLDFSKAKWNFHRSEAGGRIAVSIEEVGLEHKQPDGTPINKTVAVRFGIEFTNNLPVMLLREESTR